ncbi:MAG: LptF/LptG family permease [Gemmatimonadetes bacterium]|nr:LptF/LptG family permease [Gemmatimonadota bacterium]MBI3569078.1 LptF/LptG family permease [Gemmatimonadota bacterium]
MKRRWLRQLDRYVFVEYLKILAATVLGFPVLVTVIDITEKLDKYLARHLTLPTILKAYVLNVPYTMGLVLPAAVLFATVFAIGAFTRHSEITAAKASGISFHRFIRPIAVGSAIATLLGLALAVVTPDANAKRDEILLEKKSDLNNRFNFTFATDESRTYTITTADKQRGQLEGVVVERKGKGLDFPTYLLEGATATYSRKQGNWLLRQGSAHVLLSDSANFTMQFDSLRDRHFKEEPAHLMSNPQAPDEMGFRDLQRYIVAMERSGSDVNQLRVERMLKIAIPATCIIIMLFGAPLATSNQRGGAAYGIGVSLATTIVFLMLVQLTQAIGNKGLVVPELAAWLPGIAFGIVGGILLYRVRT